MDDLRWRLSRQVQERLAFDCACALLFCMKERVLSCLVLCYNPTNPAHLFFIQIMIFVIAPFYAPTSEDLEHTSFIVHKVERDTICWGGGLLSIKATFSGTAFYRIENGMYAVDEGRYLILNADRDYDVIKDSYQPVETLSVYFEPHFAEDALRAMRGKTEDLLDDPAPLEVDTVKFFERCYAHDTIVSPLLTHLRYALRAGLDTSMWLETLLHELLERMLRIHQSTIEELNSLTSIRPSLREEIYRRIYRAHDFALASLHLPITVRDMASIAYMSPSYFLRTYKKVFHQTPYQSLHTQRMERAAQLLNGTDLPVTHISSAVGFDSLTSFSWQFRKRFGLSPLSYRLVNYRQ